MQIDLDQKYVLVLHLMSSLSKVRMRNVTISFICNDLLIQVDVCQKEIF